MGFIYKSNGQAKSLILAVGERELRIKIDKSLQDTHFLNLLPGDWISITGEQEFKKEKFTKLKLKAYEIDRLSCDVKCNPQEETNAMGKGKACAKKGKILICNKSDCAKRGGKKLYGVLEKTISNLGLEKHVTIQKTGCQKRCGKAPNMILMPGRSKHSKPNPKNIAGLLEEHYITSGKK
ncbi:(2Fe-2S) ferredoxin domain-containing protein [Crocosphaera watsonii]|uniref:(2Fe-2S) ferredoxin domain-containing protein n=1 Tax=Crocosphaera watsonii TaxID=263511 RepID=UPI001E433505|nr:(2Fe-2S) ferredoxin domain-containing protein [Crocosphaera watsonii]